MAPVSPTTDGRSEDRAPAADPLRSREILLHRQVVTITPGRVEMRPPRSLVVVPLVGVGATAALLVVLVQWAPSLPGWALPVLLLGAVVTLPFAGLGLVYALFGANVVVDRTGGAVTWKQGFLGMGVGTAELAPFAKIRELVVEDVGRAIHHADRVEPAHAFAQWELTLVKKSGRRLKMAGLSAPRRAEEEALDRVMEVAEACAALTGAPLRGPIW